MDDSQRDDATLFPKLAGERLREAREAQEISLADVAARTRVPTRHLEAIEKSDYSALPTATYAIGFAKAYARAVGADEVAIGREVREQTAHAPRPASETHFYELSDPARVPPAGIAFAGVIVAVLLVIGAIVWMGTDWFHSGAGAPVPAAVGPIPEAPAPVTPSVAAGPGHVTLVATDAVWLRVYDAAGKTLFQNTMAAGDRFDVPADANNPMINVGRADKLQVLVNGTAVAPLGTGKRAIKDVPISAAALTARAAETPAASGTPATTNNSASTPAATAAPREQPARSTETARPKPAPARTPRPRASPSPLIDLNTTPPPLPRGDNAA